MALRGRRIDNLIDFPVDASCMVRKVGNLCFFIFKAFVESFFAGYNGTCKVVSVAENATY